MEAADFSGYATKAGLKCSDGRTIMAEAFAHQDQTKVPLVWQHAHDEPGNILGHALLEAREDGVYCHAYFNDSAPAQQAKTLVQHGDIVSLSIYANKLVERAKQVLHGSIREVSLVLSGANPGALIDRVALAHGDGEVEYLDDEAVIFTGLPLAHAEGDDNPDESEDEQTVEDVFENMTDDQKDAVRYMVGEGIEAYRKQVEESVSHSDEDTDDEDTDDEDTNDVPGEDAQNNDADDDQSSEENNDDEDTLAHKEGSDAMSRRVFDNTTDEGAKSKTLSHSQLSTIVDDTKNFGGSFRDSFLAHAAEYGIEDIDLLFPDAKSVTSTPELIARRTEWVKGVIDGAKHTPFSRIKSLAADLTADEARAKGYVKGNLKKEEVIKLLKRVTTPTTVYKKQKLDRDDVVDIVDLDVVAWIKWEMRFMLEEELARAILIGDGREVDDEDKIDEDHLRPIAWDNDMYAHQIVVPANTTSEGLVESVIRARKNYKGTGRPDFYTTDDVITDMLLIKDKMGRYVYDDEQSLANKLRVGRLIPVDVMEDESDLLGIMVNIADYTIGADKGGAISMFDDFDIDYNQLKYLIETRVSGALTKPKSAVVIKRTSGTIVTPEVPEFDQATNTITVPTQTGVSYVNVTNPLAEVALTAGADVVITETTDVEARANAGYSFPHGTDADWTFSFVE